MTVRELVYSKIGSMADEKKMIIDSVCDLCQTIMIDDVKAYEMLATAVSQYKAEEYNLFEKTLDSLLNIFGMTTSPALTKDIGFKQSIDNARVAGKIAAVSEAIDELVSSNAQLRRDAGFGEKEVARLSADLNEVNSKYAALIQENTARDKMIVTQVQRLLAEQGRDAKLIVDTPLGGLLDAFGLEYSWDNALYGDYFSVYQISDESKAGIKSPVIFRGGKAVQKGIIYQAAGEKKE